LYSPPVDRVAAFAKTGLPGKYGIGTFGRVRKQKGSDLFVEAMCMLLPRYPDFSAVVIGLTTVDNVPFVEGLKQQIAAVGLSERIEAMGERARARVITAFSRDREADEISDVYRKVWAARKG